MKISSLKIKGFRSFGPREVIIPINQRLVGFIGLNSAGKTTALDALRKLFGASLADREIHRQDFHIGKEEDPDQITERLLSIEVRIDFSEDEKRGHSTFLQQHGCRRGRRRPLYAVEAGSNLEQI